MLPAQPVADTSDAAFPLPVDMAVFEVNKADVVKNDVVMDMAAVYVRCQHIFIFAAQNLLRKLFPYLVRLFRRGLAGLKRLYQVPG